MTPEEKIEAITDIINECHFDDTLTAFRLFKKVRDIIRNN